MHIHPVLERWRLTLWSSQICWVGLLQAPLDLILLGGWPPTQQAYVFFYIHTQGFICTYLCEIIMFILYSIFWIWLFLFNNISWKSLQVNWNTFNYSFYWQHNILWFEFNTIYSSITVERLLPPQNNESLNMCSYALMSCWCFGL